MKYLAFLAKGYFRVLTTIAAWSALGLVLALGIWVINEAPLAIFIARDVIEPVAQRGDAVVIETCPLPLVPWKRP